MQQVVEKWKAEKEKKFLDDAGDLLPWAIRVMIAQYGKSGGGTKCGTCTYCRDIGVGKRVVFACKQYTQKTRWDAGWPACGNWEARKEDGKNE